MIRMAFRFFPVLSSLLMIFTISMVQLWLLLERCSFAASMIDSLSGNMVLETCFDVLTVSLMQSFGQSWNWMWYTLLDIDFLSLFSFDLTRIQFIVLTGLCYVGKLQVKKILCSCSDILLY